MAHPNCFVWYLDTWRLFFYAFQRLHGLHTWRVDCTRNLLWFQTYLYCIRYSAGWRALSPIICNPIICFPHEQNLLYEPKGMMRLTFSWGLTLYLNLISVRRAIRINEPINSADKHIHLTSLSGWRRDKTLVKVVPIFSDVNVYISTCWQRC